MKPILPLAEVSRRYGLKHLQGLPPPARDEQNNMLRDPRGDFQFGSIKTNAIYRLASRWRHTEPALAMLADQMRSAWLMHIAGTEQEQRLKQEVRDGVGWDDLSEAERDQKWIDTLVGVEAAKDQQRASQVMAASFGGSIVMVLDSLISTYREALDLKEVPHDERVGDLIGGRSLGAILWAAANNHRHVDDWAKELAPPSKGMMKSIAVLKDAVKWPETPRITVNLGAYVVDKLMGSEGNFEAVNVRLFRYAQALADTVPD
ncbi:hypothetical protein EOD42_25425 [Rhodovarius crocodyli]|uniref:Uncharacterized protein n=1 Tax=Rhodovarius crocodyli TaxID=1979269 RepID=A0A437LVA0_9PROT|nr:hypothetical protein [Rhodovarius crocodyli]RVT89286.1 hypothetical protein EOD42_25425 [Rhodovarius crocodyli]